MLLGAVLSLQTSDSGSVGGVAAQLEKAFHIGDTRLGLLITASQVLLAVAALPVGVLTDRTKRVRLLVVSIALWSVAMMATGFSTDYLMLLSTRLVLGMLTAATGPVVASLTGDLFPAQERSRIYGMILTGELLGSGVGLVFSADIGELVGWRAPFFVLAVPSLVLAYALHRLLPEPARGGQSWLRPGDTKIKSAEEVSERNRRRARAGGYRRKQVGATTAEASEVRRRARQRKDVEPRPRLVLKQDPNTLSPWAAARYILRVPSNLVLIASSVLNYFFLAGVATFAVIFIVSRYDITQAEASVIFIPIGVGAVLGTMGGGRLVDRLIQKGKIDARIFVSGLAFIGAAIAFAPGLASARLLISVPVFAVAAAFLTATNPALNAGRLDVVPSRLWGRSEAVRTLTQSTFTALAPLTFGYVSSLMGGPHAGLSSGVNTSAKASQVSLAEGHALEYTFLLMLVPLVVAGALLLLSRHAYLRDVATADLSERAGQERQEKSGSSGPLVAEAGATSAGT